MDKLRKWASLHTETRTPEQIEQERHTWEAAILANDYHGTPIYGARLSLRDDPSKSLYASIKYSWSLMPRLDIPLYEGTTDQELIDTFYKNATFFGEVDQEGFKETATDLRLIDPVMTFLNRKEFGISSKQTPEWFYSNFKVDHLNTYGDVFIGSHGGADNFNATIELRQQWREEGPPIDFANRVNKSLQHINFEPLPKVEYLRALETSLPFLPKNWDAPRR